MAPPTRLTDPARTSPIAKTPGTPAPLWDHVEEQHLGGTGGLDQPLRLTFCCRTVARRELVPVERDLAARHLKPGHPALAQRMPCRRSWREPSGIDVHVLVDRERAVTTVARRDQREAARLVERERLLF